MFDILFGWRKASKCKKLIRRVQCRLKLLKNKRGSIVRHLRDDVAQLLKYGHDQRAFNRVEQLFEDESILAVYDLLDHFCEFIIIHLSYIRRHRDCPNDINEAVSSLIYASARCGDLPELQVIRKLFGERYGQRFAMTALELLPGNLVNYQIKENLSIKLVPDDVKYRLVDEIARSCLQPGPLAIEYSSEWQQQLANKNIGDLVPNSDVQTNYNGNEGSEVQASNIIETGGKILYVDYSSESKKFIIETCPAHQDSDITGTTTHFTAVLLSSLNKVESLMHEKEGKVENHTQLKSPYKSTISTTESWSSSGIHTDTAKLGIKDVGIAAESSSDISPQFPDEMIYLDDIEELESPMRKDGNCQDQRLFLFKSSGVPTGEKFEDGYDEGYTEFHDSWNEKAGSRSSGKSRKAAGKHLRRRSVSQENRSLKNVECAIYYGESCENLPNHNCKSHYWKKHQKIPMEESQKPYCAQESLDQPCCIKIGSNLRYGKCRHNQMRSCCSCSFKSEMVNNCSLEHPCYFCVSDDKGVWETPPWKTKRRITTAQGFSTRDLNEEKLQHCIYHCQCSHNGKSNNQEVGWTLPPQKPRKNYQSHATVCDNLTFLDRLPNKQSEKLEGEAEGWDYPASCAASICSCSRVTSPWTRKETHPPYLRVMTMPPERPKDSRTDNILRSNSFPFQQPSNLSNGSSSPHVHPKLPDYDELAAKFMALKKANLQNKAPGEKPATLVEHEAVFTGPV